MNDNIEKMDESSKNPSQGHNNNKKQRATVGRGKKPYGLCYHKIQYSW
jgi:hypothetical protein